MKCQETTLKGTRCSRDALPGKKFCKQHLTKRSKTKTVSKGKKPINKKKTVSSGRKTHIKPEKKVVRMQKRDDFLKSNFGKLLIDIKPGTYYFGDFRKALGEMIVKTFDKELKTRKSEVVVIKDYIFVRPKGSPEILAGKTHLYNPFPSDKLTIGAVDGTELFYVDTDEKTKTFSIIELSKIPKKVIPNLKKLQFIRIPFNVSLYYNPKDKTYRLIDPVETMGDIVVAEFSEF